MTTYERIGLLNQHKGGVITAIKHNKQEITRVSRIVLRPSKFELSPERIEAGLRQIEALELRDSELTENLKSTIEKLELLEKGN